MRRIGLLVVAGLAAALAPAFGGTTYYADPVKGSSVGDGSAAKPWKTLEEVVAQGQLKTLKGGDTLLLLSGHHGAVTFGGDNDATVTIAAAPGEHPTLSRLTITRGSNWCVKGLVVSPSLGPAPYKGNIVAFGEGGPSTRITVEDCYVFTVEDASGWDAAQWMNANSGILMGRNGRDLTLRNCFVRNTRFGITLTSFDSLCEGNVVSGFSGDGMRATRDGERVQYNIIKNCYMGPADGDNNHDDAIQCFLFNKGTGAMTGLTFIGNIIIGNEDPNQKLKHPCQALGFFDGPLVKFVVTDNVVSTEHWHGVSLYDAQECRVESNVTWTPPGVRARAGIRLGTKQKLAKDNTVRNNYACSFDLKQPGTVAENNKPSTQAIYDEALKKAYQVICGKFGEKHVAAGRSRMMIK